MSSLFDFDKPADTYAVMGNPISHSRSPQIHAAFAQQTGQRIVYTATQVDPGGFEQAVGNFFANGGKGLNITVPFKREAWKLANELGPEAKQAGAVNTLLMNAEGLLVGRNTDGVGLVRDILQNHAGSIAGKKILLVGAGGAARGVLQPLLAEIPAQLLIVNRTPSRAYELAADFNTSDNKQGTLTGGGFDDLAGQHFDLIINATAASLQGEVPPLPDETCTANTWCYDMMYSAGPTPFMHWAEQHDAEKSVDGLGMLVEQAAESFFHWRGVRPNTAPVIQTIRAQLLNT
ncbi:MAG: shikimate dehydrogenase [Gammaproteobacteria bacterium]|nr:shikimate dehydrogenase [Gammaproteobacteria bacterium]